MAVFDSGELHRFWSPIGTGQVLEEDHFDQLPNPVRIVQTGKPRDVWNEWPWIVRRPIKEIIESLEPKSHQFFPLNLLVERTGARLSDYYIMRVTQAVDAVVVDRTRYFQGFGREGHEKSDTISTLCFEVTIKARLVSELHLWRGTIGQMGSSVRSSHHLFCSDTLRDAFKKENYYGWDFYRCNLEYDDSHTSPSRLPRNAKNRRLG